MSPAILVVDGEPVLASVLAMFLDGEGFRVRTAPNGEVALDEHRVAPADLILSDIMMPRVDGLTLVAELRQVGDQTPVVLMSAAAHRDDLPIQAPFLRKPFDLDDVLALVYQSLTTRRPSS